MVRYLLAILFLLLCSPALAQCPPNPPSTTPAQKSTVIGNINSCFADNTSGAITPSILRGVTTEMVNSFQQYPGVNATVGTTYTLATTDFGQMITTNNAAAVTFNLPQATGSFSSFSFFIQNLGTGTVTLTPTTSTVCGAATKTVPTGWGAYIVSDGTNWQCLGPFNTAVVGGGTVSSVGLTMPAVFSVANSPVTSSGTLNVTAVGTSGGIPYFNAPTTMASSGVLTANLPVIGGGAGVAPSVGTRSGNTTQYASVGTPFNTSQCVTTDSSGNLTTTGSPCGATGGGGTVISVGLSMPGIFTVTGSPVTVTGTLTATAAGTSGGIPYFSSATALASSGALTANLPVIGGGAGAAPTVGTRSGNTTQFVTTTGAQTSGHCVSIDAAGNHIDSGVTGCGGSGGTPGGATGTVQFNNGGSFGGLANVTGNTSGNLTNARLSSTGVLSWDNGSGTADLGVQRVATNVAAFSDGGTNANGWMQWAGQSRATSDTGVTNSTTFVPAGGLSVNVQAGRTYQFAATIFWNGTAASGGGKFAIGGTATATSIIYDGIFFSANATVNYSQVTVLGGTVASNQYRDATVRIIIGGTITVNTAGTLNVQFAQNAATVATSTVKAGSTFVVWDTP
jgi:hypothetical protein